MWKKFAVWVIIIVMFEADSGVSEGVFAAPSEQENELIHH
jgi:hypothetical protein